MRKISMQFLDGEQKDKYISLVKQIANECVSEMKDTDREYMHMNTEIFHYHFYK